ncbi:hypothetical protein DL765_007400 [Monosporascus sp. GIB2]|nr:hypothetical protein DL765_007400 [Monosporascus sp. GIB2]
MMFSPYIVFLAATAGLLATTRSRHPFRNLGGRGPTEARAGADDEETSGEAGTGDLHHHVHRHGALDGVDRESLVPHAHRDCSGRHLPHALLSPAGNRPGVPDVHQGVEHDGAVLDGLLSDDADDYCV